MADIWLPGRTNVIALVALEVADSFKMTISNSQYAVAHGQGEVATSLATMVCCEDGLLSSIECQNKG